MTLLNKPRPWIILLPIFGALLFLALYYLAALYYPGGSQADPHSRGFSWRDNYWCNLLGYEAINGQPNIARPLAVTGMGVLCLTLALFWTLLPSYISSGKRVGMMIRVSGILAMSTAFLIYSEFSHDTIVNLASSFGVIATGGTLIVLYNTRHYWLFGFGLSTIVLVGLNNYFYYGGGGIEYLPVVQKITFVAYLLWVFGICVAAYRAVKERGVLPHL